MLERDTWLSSDYIAGSININPVVVRKEIRKLKEAQLVAGHFYQPGKSIRPVYPANEGEELIEKRKDLAGENFFKDGYSATLVFPEFSAAAGVLFFAFVGFECSQYSSTGAKNHKKGMHMYAGQLDYVQQIYQSIELAQFDNYKDNVPNYMKIAKRYNLEDIEITLSLKKDCFWISIKRPTAHSIGSPIPVNLIRLYHSLYSSIPDWGKFDFSIKAIGFTTLFREADKKPLAEILKLADYF
ncbi:hypothetical protein FQR65_LT17567 [Abscondita terminalis]|nr:hypothetical protein FQR65_LT17567 [Abscondita terminalis]